MAIQGKNEYTPLSTRGIRTGQLPETGHGGGASASVATGCNLKQGESLNVVVQHEMKELGENTLSCSATYVVTTTQPVVQPQPTITAVPGAPSQIPAAPIPRPPVAGEISWLFEKLV